MNKFVIFLPILFFLCIACEKEDTPDPSGLDPNRMLDSLDFSKPLVKEYYEKYGVAILTKFDENLDLKFDFDTYYGVRFWNNLELGRIIRPTEVDSVLDILGEDILSCFKDEITYHGVTYHSEFRKKYFPNKILLVNQLIADYEGGGLGFESINATGAVGSLHCAINDNAVVLNLDTQTMFSSEENFQRFRKDMVYVLLAYTIDKFDLYKEVPHEFYQFSSEYYGKAIKDLQEDAGEDIHDISRFEYVDKYGLICTSVYPGSTQGFIKEITLPDKKKDFRVFIDHLINPESVDMDGGRPVYTTTLPTAQKMWYVGHTLLNWGIDIRLLNDDPNLHALLQIDEDQLDNLEIL